MITLYLWDADGVYLASETVDERGPLPARSTPTAPPTLKGAQVAQWTGSGWEALEERPAPPVPVAVIPESVTMRQCRIALLGAGLLDAVQSSIASMPGVDGERARIDWEYALEVRRDWPLIAYMAGDLGLTDEQVDALFMTAATI